MKFSSVKEKLSYINKNEAETFLFPTLRELFKRKGYKNVEVIHGKDEYGKDIIFKEHDEKLGMDKWSSVVVKNRDAKNTDFELGGELLRQIDTSFKFPYIDSRGKENYINQVLVVCNGAVTQNARLILSKSLPPHQLTNVFIWNYQILQEEIDSTIKDEFLANNTSDLDKEQITINVFRANQISRLSSISNSKEIYLGLEINDINDIFVNVKTTYNKIIEQRKNYTVYDGAKNVKTRSIEFDDSIEILNSNENCIIHGIAASGKSLLLKRIGINALNFEIEKPWIAFYFELRKLIDLENCIVDDLIDGQFTKLTDGCSFDRSKFSKLILLFDGLDELKENDDKRLIIAKISEYLDESNSKSREYAVQVILTTRNVELLEKEDLLSGFAKIELLPFDVGQAFALIKKIIPGDKAKRQSFIEAIKHNQLSNSLTRTPMALTLTAILYKEGEIDLSELPANITELYNKFSDYFLNRWDISKGLSLQYKYEEAKNIIGFIAYELHNNGNQEIGESELHDYLKRIAEFYPYEDLKDYSKFIDNLKQRSGVIQFNQEKKMFRFSHLSFQEYFASIYYDDSNESELFDNFYSEWWENSIVFYCGKQPKRSVFLLSAIQKLVPINQQQHFQYLSLLSKCLQASHLISNEAQKEVIRNLVFHFDQFYKQIIRGNIEEGIGTAYYVTNIDFTVQFRDFFVKLLSTKHIHFDSFSEYALDILLNKRTEFSDITLYSLSFYLSQKLHDPIFLEEFIKDTNLNVRWYRIIYKDLENMRLQKMVDAKLYTKIVQKQRKNQDYILEQFKGPAIVVIKDENKI